MNSYSLTRRLIATVLLIELAAALCVSSVAFFYERHAHFRAFDVSLRGRADSVFGAVQDADDVNDNVMLDGSEASSPSEDIYEVEDAGGRLLGRSPNWSGSQGIRMDRHFRHGDEGRERPPGQEAFGRISIRGAPYRVIRISGVRIVDPGEKNGAIRRYVTVYYGSPVTRVWSAVLSAVGFYAGSSLLVLAITGVLMSWLLNRGLGPLRALALSAGQVSASSWSFAPGDDVRRIRELAPLVAALEALLAGLKISFEQQQRFVGDAAHELKTGVALVKSSLQLLGMKQRSQAEYAAGLERCLEDCVRIEELVFQMLSLARIEEGSEPARNRPETNLHLVLTEAVHQFETMAQMRGIAIETAAMAETKEKPLKVLIEADELRLLYSNILMNAIQHCSRGTIIHVQVRQEKDLAVVEVRDQGDGIDPKDLPYIFERFSRGDPSRSRSTGGAGLGLAICKAIADHAGGAISIESALHQGTLVRISFPLAENPSPIP